MTYDKNSLHRYHTYATYTVHLDEDDRATFLAADDPEATITQILAAGGAPAPNQVVVHRLSSSTDSIQDELDQILKEITSGGGGTPPPQPPVAVIFHQESGPHVSRYITIVVSP